MKKAFIHFATGFEEIEALTIVDVLRRAGVDAIMISVTGNSVVKGAHDIEVVTDILFEEADYSAAEILILPGGMPGSRNLNSHRGLGEKLQEFNRDGKKIAAICAAPLVLGGLKILEGKDAVCYPGFEDKLQGAKLKYDPALKSANIITGRGPGTALDFSLLIVQELIGRTVADDLARAMLVQPW